MMVEGANRFIDAALPLDKSAVGGDRHAVSPLAPLSALAQQRLLSAAAGLLGAIEGLPDLPQLPNETAARLLSPTALRLRRELERAGAIAAKGARG